MLSLSYQESITEVLDILNHTKKSDVEKIPKKFMEFLKNHASKDYIPNLDHSQKLENMNLKPETRGILGLIYRHYWCSPEERTKYEQILNEKEKIYQAKLREKYNPDNIFKNKKDNNETFSNNTTLPQIYEKNNIFKKIFNKIKNFFSKN